MRSTFLLGAMGGGDGVISDAEAAGEAGTNETGSGTCPGGGEDAPLPMQAWALWWLVRTYLQSLGQVMIFAKDPSS